MKNNKIALKKLFFLLLLITTFIACDKDFVSLSSDISGGSNFGVSEDSYEVIAYNKKLNPVQTNEMPAHLIGFYKDLTYGTTTANMVSQLVPVNSAPNFPEKVKIDSVVMTIPYYSTSIGKENDVTKYKLDSVYGKGMINLKLYENTYFLRNFNPSGGFETPQPYYSDRSTALSNQIPLTSLKGTLITSIDSLKPSNKEIKLKNEKETKAAAPALRVKMDTLFWHQKIIKGGESALSNANNFQNYFRGIYFETEPIDNDGVMMLLNFRSSNANITMHYSSPPVGTSKERVAGTYTMNFSSFNTTTNVDSSVKANFFENDFSVTIPEGNKETGDEKLYLKGGEGSMAVIDLFGGTDVDDDEGTITEFEAFKNAFAETDADGKYVKAKRLINEASLIFYVDQELTKGQEPDRIFIYNTKTKRPLNDYLLDNAEGVLANDARRNHLGKLERAGNTPDGKGIKYKIKITEHIRNLLFKDSSNVSLGLTVSTNVNVELNTAQNSILETSNEPVKSVPVSAIISPRGTVLYGNKAIGDNKKLYLEIFYSEPNN